MKQDFWAERGKFGKERGAGGVANKMQTKQGTMW